MSKPLRSDHDTLNGPMRRALILGTGGHLPDHVVTNDDLAATTHPSDRRPGPPAHRGPHAPLVDFERDPMGSVAPGARAGARALEQAGLRATDVDLIVHATLSPERAFPGDGALDPGQARRSRVASLPWTFPTSARTFSAGHLGIRAHPLMTAAASDRGALTLRPGRLMGPRRDRC